MFWRACLHTPLKDSLAIGAQQLLTCQPPPPNLTHLATAVCTVGMFGMRKFRYRYTGKNIPVIPVYWYFGLVKS